jgi:hypothetical protein
MSVLTELHLVRRYRVSFDMAGCASHCQLCCMIPMHAGGGLVGLLLFIGVASPTVLLGCWPTELSEPTTDCILIREQFWSHSKLAHNTGHAVIAVG